MCRLISEMFVDCYNNILALDFDGTGLDFTEGKKTVEIIEKNGFAK